MRVNLNSEWGPYVSGIDARNRLCAYVDHACGPGVGVAWAANGVLFPLRAPSRPNGFGDVAVFQWSPAPPRRRPPPMDFLSRAHRFLDRCMELEAQAQMSEAQANMAMGQALSRGVQRVFTHKADTAGVAMDVICVVASLALLSTGIGVFAAMGLIGGGILLFTDGKAYGMELAGNDASAEQYKKSTEGIRLFATLISLPDFAWNGLKAIRELQEARSLLALDRTTARAAESLAQRTVNADRVARYHQVVERAHLRTQIRTQQIQASLKLEMAPRGFVAGGMGLLLQEEVVNSESYLHEVSRRLSVHVSSVHK